jgi:SAM-dependent methyltransferase
MGDVTDQPVLCLAASGGQQSAAFLVLGAEVTVYDLSETQLAKDRLTAGRYGRRLETVQGDMQDLSALGDATYSVVWIAHGINFVPSARAVLTESARRLRSDGVLRLEITNPFSHGADETWNGRAYQIQAPYIDGAEIALEDNTWEFENQSGRRVRIIGPREFRHRLSTIVNTLIASDLRILGIWESELGDPDAEPGTWAHYCSRLPPWIEIWCAGPQRA